MYLTRWLFFWELLHYSLETFTAEIVSTSPWLIIGHRSSSRAVSEEVVCGFSRRSLEQQNTKTVGMNCTDFLPRCMECRRSIAMRKLSVCLSVKCVNCDKTEERSVQIFIPYKRSFSLVFWEEEWLVGGDPFNLKFWVNWPTLEQNRQFLTNIRS